MLSNRKFVTTADCVVNDKPICGFSAIIGADSGVVQFGAVKQYNAAACEENRDIVRRDRDAFEDFVYDLKNDIRAMLGLSDSETVEGEAPAEEPAE